VDAPDTIQRATIPSERQVDREAVARRAYELYEHRDGKHGRDWDDWFQAERELGSADTIQGDEQQKF